jgi:ATPase subunit of ABC transporter with duplicated ATPase domains
MLKTCTKCGVEKVAEVDFSRSSTHAGGYSTWCKACHKQRRAETQHKYYEKHSEWKRNNKASVSEYMAEYRQQDSQKQKAAQRSRIWRQENPALLSALSAGSKAARKIATPTWANKKIIDFLYATRLYMQQDTNQDWHVDHHIPIKGKTVSGLHVHNNLRVVPATYNLRKSNKY